jgi:hypothetical protein
MEESNKKIDIKFEETNKKIEDMNNKLMEEMK